MKNAFTSWVDGEKGFPLDVSLEEHKAKKEPVRGKRLSDEQRLDGFLKFYAVCAVVICIAMLAILLISAVRLPEFGDPANPTDNIVVERYVGKAESETGAENVIAGMILNYRGFDTFGESCVLFLAVCCVMLLLWATNDKIRAEGKDGEKTAPPDAILCNVCKIVLPCIFVFGICVLFNGHISPGGGFSGGSVLGAALILFAVAYGADAVHRFFTKPVFNLVRITGLMIYALMFGVYIYQGANGIQSDLAHYIVLVIDIAVGLVVMSTMYGFFSFYTKGDL